MNALHVLCILSTIHLVSHCYSALISPTLQLRKVRNRKVKQISWGYTIIVFEPTNCDSEIQAVNGISCYFTMLLKPALMN